ncbi:MAG TPA: DeoR/GlpR family DNA-binding transcription regulator [Streptosporangiaceae bacterium]|nr:DeoR/GlpR family DNA-binding transcription regulator [Streptosporangiaceae bacterium]
MLAVERRERILRSLERSAAVSTDEFAAELGVSPETVRRDLIQLERRGMLRRVHGGAAPLARPARLTSAEPVYSERVLEQFEAKQAIGLAAAALVQPGQTVVIDVGTTCLEVARALPHDLRATIATPSLLVAAELSTRPQVQVLMAGGRVRAGDLACSGAETIDFFRDLHADVAFLGSGALSPGAGLTDYNRDEVPTKRMILARAEKVLALVDSSKFDRVAPYRVCDLSELDGVVAETSLPEGPEWEKASRWIS